MLAQPSAHAAKPKGLRIYVSMAHALRDAGHDVYVFTEAIGPASSRGLSTEDGLTVFRLPRPVFARGIAGDLVHLASIARHVRSFVRRFDIDVVEAADYGGETALLRSDAMRARVCVKLHTPMQVKDAVLGKRAVARGRLVYALERRAILGADLVTTPSSACAELTRNVLRAPALRATVVRNPIDLDQWSPNGSPRGKALLFVGRLEPYKGPDRLPAILNRLLARTPVATARFVGDDSAFPGVVDQVKSSIDPDVRGRVSFVGRVPRRELVEEYRSAAVCLIPSRFEAFCYVCAEAMACGVPVVASIGTAMDELIRDGESGHLVDYDDVEAVATVVGRLLSDESLAQRIGRLARQEVRRLCAPGCVVAEWVAAVTAEPTARPYPPDGPDTGDGCFRADTSA
jgi:glycosyltransferase involved in cell wall biosynthesis